MWNLPKRHDSMMEMTGWLSPPAAEWCQTHCRFQQVYPAEPIALHHPSTEAKAGESLSDTH